MKRIIVMLAIAASILSVAPAKAETVKCRWPWQPALMMKVDANGRPYLGVTCIYVVPGGKPKSN